MYIEYRSEILASTSEELYVKIHFNPKIDTEDHYVAMLVGLLDLIKHKIGSKTGGKDD